MTWRTTLKTKRSLVGVNIAFLIVFALHPLALPKKNRPLFENRALAFIFQFMLFWSKQKQEKKKIDGKDILAKR